MSKRRALDRCRRKADDGRARPAMVDEPLDNSAFTVWPSIGRQLPPRSVIFDMLCFYATPTVRSDLMQPLRPGEGHSGEDNRLGAYSARLWLPMLQAGQGQR